jgi:hypothetical protein
VLLSRITLPIMRIILRLVFIATAAVLFLTILLIKPTRSLPPTSWQTTPPTSNWRPYTKPTPLPWDPPHPKAASSRKPTSQLIVKVQLPDEDISWLSTLAPTWTNQLIPIDGRFTRLHANGHRVDRGRIAAAYLTWIIENYHRLPTSIVFLAPTQQRDEAVEKEEEEVEEPRLPHLQTQQDIQALDLAFLQATGFALLPCPAPSACAHLRTPFGTPSYELRTLEAPMPGVWHALFNNTRVPTALAAVPAAQFAVSRAQVLQRGVAEYERYWAWLHRTKMDDESAGRIVEYLWHVIFGREVVFCPAFATCECEAFGRC